MDRLPRKRQSILHILCSYAGFVVLAFVFACASILCVSRTWLHETKDTISDTFCRREDTPSTSTENTATDPPHTMTWEEMRWNLASYSALIGLSVLAFVCRLLNMSNAFTSIRTMSRNIALRQIENSSDLKGLVLQAGKSLVARRRTLSISLRQSVPSEGHHQNVREIHSLHESSNHPSSQKRKEDALNTELLSDLSAETSHESHQKMSTREKSKKIRLSKLADVEHSKDSTGRLDRINVDNSKHRKLDGKSHEESQGLSSQLPRSDNTSSLYKINEGAGPSTQSYSYPQKENSEMQISTFLDSYCAFIDRSDKSLKMQISSLKSPTTIDSSQRNSLPENSGVKIRIPLSSLREVPSTFSEADVSQHLIKESGDSQHERAKLPHSSDISGTNVPSCSHTQLPERSLHGSPWKIASSSETVASSNPCKRSLDKELSEQCSSSKSLRTRIGSSPIHKSPDKNLKLQGSSSKYPGRLINFSRNNSPEKSRKEIINVSLSSLRVSTVDVGLHKTKQSTEEFQHESDILSHSPVALSHRHVPRSPGKQLPEVSCHESPRKIGSPYAFSKYHLPSIPVKAEKVPFKGSPYAFSKSNLRSNTNKTSVEGSRYEKPLGLGSLSPVSESCIHPMPHEQSSVRSQNENLSMQQPSAATHIDSTPNILSDGSLYENKSTPDQSFLLSGTDVAQHSVEQSAGESLRGNPLLQISSVANSSIHEEKGTTTVGKVHVDIENPVKSPFEINVALETGRDMENMLPRFHTATTSSDKISEECKENSPTQKQMKCTNLLQSMEDDTPHLRESPCEPDSTEMNYSSQNSCDILLPVPSSYEVSSSEMSSSLESSRGVLLPGPSCVPTSVVTINIHSEEALVESTVEETG